METNYQKIAQSILTKIKNELKKGKDKDVSSFEMEIWLNSYQGKDTFIIKDLYHSDIVKGISLNDLQNIRIQLIELLKKLKATKGWDMLSYEITDAYTYRSGWSYETIKFPTKITLLSKPCKEYTSLSKYLSKHSNIEIKPFDIYAVRIGGKRGRVYGEESNRYYLCHNPQKCNAILDTLRSIKKSNDKLNCCPIKTIDDIDKWELECSIRNEVEFSGMRYTTLQCTIQTPKGKIKRMVNVENYN